jgi:lipid-A-disaccharide synthase
MNEKNLQLSPPSHESVDILFIAGEHSGDQHAARIASTLFTRRPDIKIAAIGGQALERAGVQLLYDLTQLSVVGIVEVARHFTLFRRLLAESCAWIEKYKPSVVCFVDYPGFNMRLASMLYDKGISNRAGGNVSLFYYISPQIWAWKARRRFEIARDFDALAVIFPFEVECYKDTRLDVRFVGHPLVARDYISGLSYDPKGPVLLLPGSRVQPITRIFPTMLDSFKLLLRKRPDAHALALYPDAKIRDLLEYILSSHDIQDGSVELRPVDTGASARACLISSGTMSLDCALAAIPGAICYRAHPLTYIMGRALVKVPYLGIANLLLPDSPPYPELLQGDAKPAKLAAILEDALAGPQRAEKSAAAAALLRGKLSAEGSTDVATWLMKFLIRK